MRTESRLYINVAVLICAALIAPLACTKKQETKEAPPVAAPTTEAAPVQTPAPQEGAPMTPSTTPTTAKEKAVLDTSMGTIELEFFPDVAPKHVENFIKLSKQGFYDGTTFHRVIPGFVIQGGDPNSKDDDRTNDGYGGPGYSVPAEFNNRLHQRGTLSMARGGDPNSAGSQFFICVNALPNLDHMYTVFGQVIKGMEVVDKIVASPRDKRDNPLQKVTVKKVTIAPM